MSLADAVDPHASSYLRYVNHDGARPNVFLDVARVKRRYEREIKFYTSRAVAAGEELCFDYGPAYWEARTVPL